MNIHKYKNYEEYEKAQIAANHRKIDKVWAKEGVIESISRWIEQNVYLTNPKRGICHGTRNGKEQEWFEDYTGIETIGTEISDTAEEFPKTIQWDFNKENKEWINKFDFVYSNSLDHSPNPEGTLKVWMKQLKEKGVLVIEWHETHNSQNQGYSDPFSANLKEYKELLEKVGLVIQEEINIQDRTILICQLLNTS